ncbi:hypothetical protein DVH24_007961 [Malus domestica]|uniref:BAG domain-containing protein n=1 Tax=Malus domestica TaxID=3750 RepID=A0A498JQC5_MALDO|nr:hypothetical protein DVH24_007961 [Malus domestica]
MLSSESKRSVDDGSGGPDSVDLEIKPGGMLVQKRTDEMNPSSISIHTIKVRVKGIEENVGRANEVAPSGSEADIQKEREGLQKVTALETTDSTGGKVSTMDVENLTELMMMKLIKLDGIVGTGHLKLQRRV